MGASSLTNYDRLYDAARRLGLRVTLCADVRVRERMMYDSIDVWKGDELVLHVPVLGRSLDEAAGAAIEANRNLLG